MGGAIGGHPGHLAAELKAMHDLEVADAAAQEELVMPPVAGTGQGTGQGSAQGTAQGTVLGKVAQANLEGGSPKHT